MEDLNPLGTLPEHTAEPWEFIEQGEANEYALVTPGGKWVIGFLQNGELMPARQRANARRIAAAVNACAGIDTDKLLAFAAFRAKVNHDSPAQRMAVRYQWSKLLGDA